MLEKFDAFLEAARRRRVAVFLDYDGTLTPIVKNPDRAYMSDQARRAAPPRAPAPVLSKCARPAKVPSRGARHVASHAGTRGAPAVACLGTARTRSAATMHSAHAHVSASERRLLRGAQMRAAVRATARLFPTAIISGRGREKVESFVQLKELYYAGSHGMDIVGPRVRAPRQRPRRATPPAAPRGRGARRAWRRPAAQWTCARAAACFCCTVVSSVPTTRWGSVVRGSGRVQCGGRAEREAGPGRARQGGPHAGEALAFQPASRFGPIMDEVYSELVARCGPSQGPGRPYLRPRWPIGICAACCGGALS